MKMSRRRSPLARPLRVAMVAAALALAACGSANHTPVPTLKTSGPVSTPAPGQLKPVLHGLLDRTGEPPAQFLSSLAGYVVNAHWSDLQPAQGGPIAANNVIDQSIAAVRAINASAHLHLGLKVRLYAGIWAPDWAKNLGGGPVQVADPSSGQGGTVGRFWTDAFGEAYADLQNKLAAKYDSVPEVREVTISRCMTVFAEPLIRDISNPSAVQALLSAGYSVTADEQCQQQQITAHRVWQHTRSDLSFNPYQVINSDGSTSTDEAFTESLMDYCRHELGRACVLENNSLRQGNPPNYQAMYAHMQSLGPPIAIQTAASKKVTDLISTIQTAAGIGASSVELPSDYQAQAPTTLSGVAQSLASSP